jgi:hypothetical protein
MMAAWKSPVYSFYEPIPQIQYVGNRKAHVFRCVRALCKFECRRYLDSKLDRTSTGNLSHHAKSCWGDEAFNMAVQCGNINEARKKVVNAFNFSETITASFKRSGKGKVTYMARNHIKMEIK